MKVLITSGGTKIPIDTVRHIDNMSSGTFGSKIAYEFLKANHDVIFFKRKGSKSPLSTTIDLIDGYSIGEFAKWYNDRVKLQDRYIESEFDTFTSYKDGLEKLIKFDKPDLIILAAAVSDYGVKNFIDGKVRSSDNLKIELEPLPKLIKLAKEWSPRSLLVGFKLLVNSTDEELKDAAKQSIDNNGCDMVIANDLRDIKNNDHRLFIVTKNLLGMFIVTEFMSDKTDKNSLAKIVVDRSLKLFWE